MADSGRRAAPPAAAPPSPFPARFPGRPALSPRRPRQPRAGRAQGAAKRSPRKTGAWAAVFSLLAAAILAFSLLLASETSKLEGLRAEKLRARQEHEDLVGYYAGLRRASGVRDIIDRYAAEYGVDPSFISAVIARESHFDPAAQSAAGARGLMQVMEDTGEWIASRLGAAGYEYGRLFDPDLNIRFGTWYLSYLSSLFSGSPVMILSAYHAGPGNAALWALRYADDRQTLAAGQIPMEDTRDYVGKVMDAYALYYEYDSAR